MFNYRKHQQSTNKPLTNTSSNDDYKMRIQNDTYQSKNEQESSARNTKHCNQFETTSTNVQIQNSKPSQHIFQTKPSDSKIQDKPQLLQIISSNKNTESLKTNSTSNISSRVTNNQNDNPLQKINHLNVMKGSSQHQRDNSVPNLLSAKIKQATNSHSYVSPNSHTVVTNVKMSKDILTKLTDPPPSNISLTETLTQINLSGNKNPPQTSLCSEIKSSEKPHNNQYSISKVSTDKLDRHSASPQSVLSKSEINDHAQKIVATVLAKKSESRQSSIRSLRSGRSSRSNTMQANNNEKLHETNLKVKNPRNEYSKLIPVVPDQSKNTIALENNLLTKANNQSSVGLHIKTSPQPDTIVTSAMGNDISKRNVNVLSGNRESLQIQHKLTDIRSKSQSQMVPEHNLPFESKSNLDTSETSKTPNKSSNSNQNHHTYKSNLRSEIMPSSGLNHVQMLSTKSRSIQSVTNSNNKMQPNILRMNSFIEFSNTDLNQNSEVAVSLPDASKLDELISNKPIVRNIRIVFIVFIKNRFYS